MLLTCLFGALLAGAVALAQQEQPERFALVIGNGGYQHVDPLPNPINDASAVADKLRALDFRVTEAIDQSLEEIRQTIVEFGRDSIGAEVALIFYAGHGMQIDGENYLLPVDSRPQDPATLDDHALRAAELHSIFSFVEPELALMILDACRDNPFIGVVTQTPGLASGAVSEDEFGAPKNKAGVLIAFSAAPGEVAEDGEVDGNSPFSTALLRWIDRPGIEIGSMFRKVRETVLQLTGGAQVPWVEESLTGAVYLHSSPADMIARTDVTALADLLSATIGGFEHPAERRAAAAFYGRLLPGRVLGEEARVVEASLEGGAVEAPNDPSFIRESFVWLSIRDSDDPAVFETFLEHFPDSALAGVAETRLAHLRDETAGPAPADDASAEMVADADADAEADEPGEAAPTPDVAEADQPPDDRFAPVDPQIYAAVEDDLSLDRSQRIALQALLGEMGHYDAALDGAIGPVSRAAIEEFQAAAGLFRTGFVDRATLRALSRLAAGRMLRRDLAPERRAAIHELAAIGLRGSDARPVEIRVASYQRDDAVLALWSELARDFEADNPGVQVRFDIRSQPEYKARLLAMLGGRQPPDIFVSYGGGHLRALVEAGFARDITEEMADGWALEFKPSALSSVVLQERLYGVPYRMTMVSLWANRTLLQAAGVDPATLDTWSGLTEAAEKLQAAGITPLAVGAGEGWPMSMYWAGLAQAIAGRSGMEDALEGVSEGFEDPAFVRAGERLLELVALDPFQSEFLSRDENESIGAFTDGWTAMLLNGDWFQPRLMKAWKGADPSEELIRIAFPPRDLIEGDTMMTLGGVSTWVVRDGAPDVAVDFLREFAGLEPQVTLAQQGYGIPTIAGADVSIDDPIQQEIAEALTVTEYHQLYLDQLLGPVAGETVNEAVVALAEGTVSPQEAAQMIETAWAPWREAWNIGTIPHMQPFAAE